MYQAVLFDLDGTLTNTLQDIADAMNRSLRINELDEWPVDAYRYLVGNGARILAQRAVRDRADLWPAVLAEYQSFYETHTEVTTRPYEGIPELLQALESRGIKICVFSNKPHADTQHVVRHFFPEVSFASIRGQQEGIPVKPDPVGALLTAQAIGVLPEHCLYVGDTGTDMECACRAGMHAVGVTWGFREEKELWDTGAKDVISHPIDLLTLLDHNEAI